MTKNRKKDNFIKAVELTEKDMNQKLPSFSKKYHEKWVQLLSCWNSTYEWDGIDGLMFHVLHKLHWKMYPGCTYTKEQKEILKIVEKEIRTNPKARVTWVQTDYVMEIWDALRNVQGAFVKNGPRYVTSAHGFYLDCRSNLLIDEEVLYEEFLWVQNYEHIIKTLLPEATKWTERAWLDEKAIFEGMAEKYNIIFDEHDPNYVGDDYDVFIRLLNFQLEKDRSGYVIVANQLESCSAEMADILWPSKREPELVKLLSEMVARATRGVFNRGEIEKSWVFKQVDEWRINNHLKKVLDDQARKTIFDFQMMCG